MPQNPAAAGGNSLRYVSRVGDMAVAASGGHREAPAGSKYPSALPVLPGTASAHGPALGLARGPSREMWSVTVAAVDFCLLLTTTGAAFTVDFNLVTDLATDPPRYLFPALFAATMFVGGFKRLGGCQLKQLSKADWQLTLAIMNVTASVLPVSGISGENFTKQFARLGGTA